MIDLIQTLLEGIARGSTYALLALGFVMIYKATHVVSFAQPALMVTGGLVAYHFQTTFELPFWVALLAGIAGGALIGVVLERIFMRPMVGKPVFTLAIITVGIDIVLRMFANSYIGVGSRSVNLPRGKERIDFGPFNLNVEALAVITITAVAVVALTFFFQYSKAGIAMRATALDQETALAQGINVGWMFSLAWAFAGALAAIAGTFIAADYGGLSEHSFMIAFFALPAIIIGGLDSFKGAVIGGLIVGLVFQLSAQYQHEYAPWLGSQFEMVAPFVVMFIVLLIRPYGLFGTREVERV